MTSGAFKLFFEQCFNSTWIIRVVCVGESRARAQVPDGARGSAALGCIWPHTYFFHVYMYRVYMYERAVIWSDFNNFKKFRRCVNRLTSRATDSLTGRRSLDRVIAGIFFLLYKNHLPRPAHYTAHACKLKLLEKICIAFQCVRQFVSRWVTENSI